MTHLDSIIRKHVLKNTFDYGKANTGSIVGKVIAEWPGCKTDMKSTMTKINNEIKRVSKLGKDEIAQEMSSFEYYVKEEKEKIIELPDAEKGNVITRFPPEPSGYPHIGHAKAAWLNHEAARVYDGKIILRFDDTNPEKESEEFVDAIRDDLKWLGITFDKESYTSDNMDKIYVAAEKLIKDGNAYVSTAPRENISDSRSTAKPLPERSNAPEENMKKWKDMLAGKYEKGECLLLFKGDLKSDNTVMHDPALARVIKSPHYRQKSKYIVWPGYDLAVVVMDHYEGITHAMRSKEYELRDELYNTLFDLFEWKKPKMISFSRLAIKGAPISKRLITPLIKDKKVTGWDDPRLPTVAGLRRRGIMPDAIKQFVLSFGLSKVESEPDWESLLSYNRKLLDPKSPHYYFVSNPMELHIKNMEEREISLKLHPKQNLGNRVLIATSCIYISADDANRLEKGDIFRLKDLCNIKLTNKVGKLEAEIMSDGVVEKKIQWVSDKDKRQCSIIVPKDLLNSDGEYQADSLQILNGYCEKNCAGLTIGTMVQFERFGFCRFDRFETKDNVLVFVFSC
ncbi:MAG: glutamate--tRNA ligase [Candidatus Micrarchaeota archaeon]